MNVMNSVVQPKPLIKRSHHVIVSDEGDISIGEIPGYAKTIRSPDPWVLEVLTRLDGRHTIQRVYKEVKNLHDSVDITDIETLINLLHEHRLLEVSRVSRDLTASEEERYDRQILQYELFDRSGISGIDYQAKIKKSVATVFGMGGWGTWISMQLALNGFGAIKIIDGDVVELSNLNRQVLYDNSHIGALKVDAAKEALKRINPDVECIGFPHFVSPNRDEITEYVIGSSIVFIGWASLGFYRKGTAAEIIHTLCQENKIPVVELGGDPISISAGPLYPYDTEKIDYSEIKESHKNNIYVDDHYVAGLQQARMKNQFSNGNRTVNAWQSSASLSIMSGIVVDQSIKHLTGYANCALSGGAKFHLDLGSLESSVVAVK